MCRFAFVEPSLTASSVQSSCDIRRREQTVLASVDLQIIISFPFKKKEKKTFPQPASENGRLHFVSEIKVLLSAPSECT